MGDKKWNKFSEFFNAYKPFSNPGEVLKLIYPIDVM